MNKNKLNLTTEWIAVFCLSSQSVKYIYIFFFKKWDWNGFLSFFDGDERRISISNKRWRFFRVECLFIYFYVSLLLDFN